MGLLDSLLKKTVSQTVNQASKKVESSVKNAVSDGIAAGLGLKPSSKPAASATAAAPSPAAAEAAPAAAAEGEKTYKPAPTLTKVHKEKFVPVKGADLSDKPVGSPDYFIELAEKNFGMTGRVYVPLAEIGQTVDGRSMDVPIMLYKGAKPALAVFLVPKNDYRKYAVINSMNACEAAGIPAIRFFQEFSNDAAYVVGRMNAVML